VWRTEVCYIVGDVAQVGRGDGVWTPAKTIATAAATTTALTREFISGSFDRVP
jgi:hypothetical protein